MVSFLFAVLLLKVPRAQPFVKVGGTCPHSPVESAPRHCYLVKCVLIATIENKTTSVTSHFKKLTTANYVFIVSVII